MSMPQAMPRADWWFSALLADENVLPPSGVGLKQACGRKAEGRTEQDRHPSRLPLLLSHVGSHVGPPG